MVQQSLSYDLGTQCKVQNAGPSCLSLQPRALQLPNTSVEEWHDTPHFVAGRNDTQSPRDTRNFRSSGFGAPVPRYGDSRRTGPHDGQQCRKTRNPARAPSRTRPLNFSDGACLIQGDARVVVAKDRTGRLRHNYGNSGRGNN